MRCKEFYDKWEKDPNFCEKCPSAVSQINSYLEWVNALEAVGVNRDFTFVKLPEAVARPLSKFKDEARIEKVVELLALEINNPDKTKVTPAQLRNITSLGFTRKWTPPSYETKIRRNEKRIEELESQLRVLKQDNENLRRSIVREAHKNTAPTIVETTITTDINDKPRIVSETKVVGVDAVKEKLAKTAEVLPL